MMRKIFQISIKTLKFSIFSISYIHNERILLDLKLRSPEKSNEDSQNIEEWLLNHNLDYNSLTELGKKQKCIIFKVCSKKKST